MDFEENMVGELDNGQEEDSLPEEIAEVPEETGESLESLNEGEEEQPAEEETQPQGTSEPGYVQRRISKAVAKAVAETEARMTAMFEKQMAPIRAKMIEDEAQELVRSRKVADIETARELVQFRQGIAPAAEPESQPRNEKGQYTSNNDAVTAARIDMLRHQADRIKADSGLDVIAEWNSNKEIKEAVINGEMDFYDVAKQMGKPKKRPPSPVRSPNGASGQSANAIDSMSDAQFEKLEKRIREGARFTLR